MSSSIEEVLGLMTKLAAVLKHQAETLKKTDNRLDELKATLEHHLAHLNSMNKRTQDAVLEIKQGIPTGFPAGRTLRSRETPEQLLAHMVPETKAAPTPALDAKTIIDSKLIVGRVREMVPPEVWKALADHGACIFGGAVRDAVAGIAPSDLDVALFADRVDDLSTALTTKLDYTKWSDQAGIVHLVSATQLNIDICEVERSISYVALLLQPDFDVNSLVIDVKNERVDILGRLLSPDDPAPLQQVIRAIQEKKATADEDAAMAHTRVGKMLQMELGKTFTDEQLVCPRPARIKKMIDKGYTIIPPRCQPVDVWERVIKSCS